MVCCWSTVKGRGLRVKCLSDNQTVCLPAASCRLLVCLPEWECAFVLACWAVISDFGSIIWKRFNQSPTACLLAFSLACSSPVPICLFNKLCLSPQLSSRLSKLLSPPPLPCGGCIRNAMSRSNSILFSDWPSYRECMFRLLFWKLEEVRPARRNIELLRLVIKRFLWIILQQLYFSSAWISSSSFCSILEPSLTDLDEIHLVAIRQQFEPIWRRFLLHGLLQT